MNQILLGGVGVYPFSSADSLINYALEHPGILVAVNAEKILHATEQTRSIINSGIGYTDGIGAVMALRHKGYAGAVKIAGCELWLQIIAKTYKTKSFYFVGGKSEVIEATVQKLRLDFPEINIVGYRDGYLKEGDDDALIADIAIKKPDVVFVAMGSPKQELLMGRMQEQHPQAIYQGLGGSFDVYVGNVERAPEWWLRHNLEFAYRLLKQPSRIKRQIHLVRFLWKLYSNQL